MNLWGFEGESYGSDFYLPKTFLSLTDTDYLTSIWLLSCVFYCLSEYSMPFFETSAATGQNVDKAVEALLSRVMLRIESIVDKSMFHGKRVQNGETSDNSGCGC